jgi:hypothetical protein
MTARQIFSIPFWFNVQIMRQRCRKKETVLLRGVEPVQIDLLDENEAPVAIEIAIRDPHRGGISSLQWRCDGTSYLRAIRRLSPDRPAGSHHDRGAGAPMTMDDFQSVLDWNAGTDFLRDEFPNRWLTRLNEKLADVRIFGKRHYNIAPADLHTAESLEPMVREWWKNGEDEGRARTASTAQDYVFVNGALHRRVPPPLWCWSNSGGLVHGEDLAERRGYKHTSQFWWPISRTDDFIDWMTRSKQPEYLQMDVEVRVSIPPDEFAALTEVGFAMFGALEVFINTALPRLDDESLDLYKKFRVARAAASVGEFDGCRAAARFLRSMLPDPAWQVAQQHKDVKSIIEAHLDHWDRLLYAAGVETMVDEDEMALGALAT